MKNRKLTLILLVYIVVGVAALVAATIITIIEMESNLSAFAPLPILLYLVGITCGVVVVTDWKKGSELPWKTTHLRLVKRSSMSGIEIYIYVVTKGGTYSEIFRSLQQGFRKISFNSLNEAQGVIRNNRYLRERNTEMFLLYNEHVENVERKFVTKAFFQRQELRMALKPLSYDRVYQPTNKDERRLVVIPIFKE